MESEIMTTEEVAKMLKIKKGSILSGLCKDRNYIPHIKVGRLLRFERSKVLKHFGFSTNEKSNS